MHTDNPKELHSGEHGNSTTCKLNPHHKMYIANPQNHVQFTYLAINFHKYINKYSNLYSFHASIKHEQYKYNRNR